MPEIVVPGLRMAVKDIITYRRVIDGRVVECFDSRVRLLGPNDNMKELGEHFDTVYPVLQVNEKTGTIFIT